jgi:mercuric ion binding protein
VAGVSKIDVSLERREAEVTFDDAKANAEALTRATKDAGYPSTVVGAAK